MQIGAALWDPASTARIESMICPARCPSLEISASAARTSSSRTGFVEQSPRRVAVDDHRAQRLMQLVCDRFDQHLEGHAFPFAVTCAACGRNGEARIELGRLADQQRQHQARGEQTYQATDIPDGRETTTGHAEQEDFGGPSREYDHEPHVDHRIASTPERNDRGASQRHDHGRDRARQSPGSPACRRTSGREGLPARQSAPR